MEIVKGYDMALKKCLDILPSLAVEELEDVKDLEKVKRALRSSLASKQCGSEDFLAGLVSQACGKRSNCIAYVKHRICHGGLRRLRGSEHS